MLTALDVLHVAGEALEVLGGDDGVVYERNCVEIEFDCNLFDCKLLASYHVDEERRRLVLVLELEGSLDISDELAKTFLPILHSALFPFLELYPGAVGQFVPAHARGGDRTFVYVSHVSYENVEDDDEELDFLMVQLGDTFFRALRSMTLAAPLFQVVGELGRPLNTFETIRALIHMHGVLELDRSRNSDEKSDYRSIQFPDGLYGGISEAVSACN